MWLLLLLLLLLFWPGAKWEVASAKRAGECVYSSLNARFNAGLLPRLLFLISLMIALVARLVAAASVVEVVVVAVVVTASAAAVFLLELTAVNRLQSPRCCHLHWH